MITIEAYFVAYEMRHAIHKTLFRGNIITARHPVEWLRAQRENGLEMGHDLDIVVLFWEKVEYDREEADLFMQERYVLEEYAVRHGHPIQRENEESPGETEQRDRQASAAGDNSE